MFIKRGWYYLFPIFLCGITFHLLVPRKTHLERIQPILLQASNKAINTKQLKFHWRYKMESCLLYECELGWNTQGRRARIGIWWDSASAKSWMLSPILVQWHRNYTYYNDFLKITGFVAFQNLTTEKITSCYVIPQTFWCSFSLKLKSFW